MGVCKVELLFVYILPLVKRILLFSFNEVFFNICFFKLRRRSEGWEGG